MDIARNLPWFTDEFEWKQSLSAEWGGLTCLNNTQNQALNERFIETSPRHLGILTGVTLAVLIGIKLREIKLEYITSNQRKLTENATKHMLKTAICFITSLILSPIIAAILMIFSTYRTAIKVILTYKCRDNFICLLDSADSVWALEDEKANSIITILGFLKVQNLSQNGEILEKVRSCIQQKLFSHREMFSKMFYKRKEFGGYFYWEQNRYSTVNDHVLSLPSMNTENCITQDMLATIIGKYCGSSLTDPTSSWEILVGNEPVRSADAEFKYPVVFRIHHTLGDGHALLHLLLSQLSDNAELTVPTCISKKYQRLEPTEMPSNCKFSILSVWNTLRKMFVIPVGFVDQATRVPDDNALHCQVLCGEKVVAWWIDSDGSVLEAVKNVKNHVPDTRFSDVIVCAISAGFTKYFKMTSSDVPPHITAVIPVQYDFKSANSNDFGSKLTNTFSVGLLTVPLTTENERSNQLTNVKKYTTFLRNSPDFTINYWVMSILSGVLPSPFLRPILCSAHSTTVISNIPGPAAVSVCGGLSLDNIIFWTPNRGTTGLGLSILSYDGRLHIGIIADAAFISNVSDAEKLLLGIVDEIINMKHELIK